MPVRVVTAMVLLFALAACGGGSAPSAPPSTAGTGPGGTGSAAPVSTGAAIDLSNVDVCAIIPEATVEQLTGESGFDADGSSSASSAKCFWAVPIPGVPQYVEVEIGRAPANLEGQGLTLNGVSCPAAPVPGVDFEAVGGVCPGEQTLVWLAAMDQGMFVRVLVNEPKSALDPARLAAAARTVLDALG